MRPDTQLFRAPENADASATSAVCDKHGLRPVTRLPQPAYTQWHPTVATPVISPDGGSFGDAPVSITLTCSTPGAVIHYTIDGSAPTSASTLYSAPFLLPGSCSVKAIGVKATYNDSAVASFAFTVSPLSAPVFSPPAGSFSDVVVVTISQAEGADMYVTLDGSTPTTSSALYAGSFEMDTTTTTVKVLAVKAGYLDTVTTAIFAITLPIDMLGSLSGLHWTLPFIAHDIVPHVCTTSNPANQVVTLSGAAGRTYNVTLRIRGYAELNSYSGGSAGPAPHVHEGGISQAGLNIYSLSISSPSKSYYLNHGTFVDPAAILDYTFTLQMTAGATLTLHADNQDGYELENWMALSVPVAGGDPPILVTQPYNGQFLQMDVVAITLVP